LTVSLDEHGSEEADIRERISKGALRVRNSAVQIEGKNRRYVFDLTDASRRPDASIPPHIKALASEHGVTQIVWRRRE
jgi:RNase P subunit RPR2